MPTLPAEAVTPREHDVLVGVAQHLTNAQIARDLHLSVRTVETHVSALLRKLGVASRRDLAATAAGLTARPDGSARPADHDGPRRVPGPHRHSLRSAGTPSGVIGLPAPRTSFVGRRAEVDAATRLAQESRLTTIVGPGGAGKTRLAIAATTAVAPAFPSGGAYVDLVPTRPGHVDEAVATALGVTEGPGQTLRQALAAALRGRVLLVLDNAEHLVDDVTGLVEDLLDACPGLSIVATSRERLAVAGETVLLLGPLHVADEAVVLFTERARDGDPAFAAEPADVEDLCRRLDCSPLAIELAAARVASLGVAGLRAGLADQLRVVAASRGGHERHRSLRAVIEWSHRLLAADERYVLARTSLFAGSFTLSSAAALCPDLAPGTVADVVGRLGDKSLVHRAEDAARWTLLASVRQFAREQLDASDDAGRTVGLYRTWAASTAADLRRRMASGADWWDALELVQDDLRACARLEDPSVPTRDGGGRALPGGGGGGATRHALVRDLARLTTARGCVGEARGHFLAAARLAPSGAAAARDLADAASCAHLLTHAKDAYDLLLEAAQVAGADGGVRADALAGAVVVARRFLGSGFERPVERPVLEGMFAEADRIAAGDDDGASRRVAPVAVARAWLSGDGAQLVDAGAAAHAVAQVRETGDVVLLSAALDASSTAWAASGRPDESHRLAGERLDLVALMDRSDPGALVEIVDAHRGASAYAIATGAVAEALEIGERAAAETSLAAYHRRSLDWLVVAAALAGDHARAVDLAERSWSAFLDAGRPRTSTFGVPMLAGSLAAGLAGDSGGADRWRERAREGTGLADFHASPNLAPWDAFVRARLALHTGELDGVLASVGAEFSPGRFDGYAAAVAAEIAVVAGSPNVEDRLETAARHAGRNRWVAASLQRSRARLTGDTDALHDAAELFGNLGAAFERERTLALVGT
ncbi:transcriptional regulator, LuxR family [Beutenbergia cavernae DSM 12333]|uniref:Transcriptional regulator, LuxR family n=1 Tax=Beutenbergia cavernae (strain ATCC BAA-8 / DSM 12333 / CCUG 43141 / JCM 11478 / NBRC 16432 / NCIMB 13614 / HKI 0122) TaxID=471853 RepID=C5BX32_BEUC1|nr:LuxR C-terminal-related transcriptional regulator [Beutenbergia cavernae]ACQ78707.1 transcriptional regulator, LuxR family [Beutenbergia cavernae DSM 12333]